MAASANPSANDENSRHGAAPPPSNNGNSAAETSGQQTSVGLRHNPGISTEWSADEQSILDELVIKHASEPSIVRYAKIAVQLKDKTVRDVALLCRWMTDHKVRIIQWMIPSSGFVFMAMLLDICGMHLNKDLYSLTYTCLTAGVAVILFSGIYILVDVYGFRRPLTNTQVDVYGKHALAIFILAACNIVPIVLLGVYWREPQNNLLWVIGVRT